MSYEEGDAHVRTAMPTAYSYVRFSTPEQAKGDSLRRQTEKAVQYASTHNLTLDKRLNMHDHGVSAFRGANVRKGALRRFLDAVEEGIVEKGSYLLVESLDRVSRADPWEALPHFQNIINAGITIVTLQDGRVWNKQEMRGNPMRIMESILVMMRGNEESRRKSYLLKEKWAKKRADAGAKPLTSKAPAWLALDKAAGKFKVQQERAKVVKRIFRMALAGHGQHSIAEALNADRVPTFGKAAHWQRSYVKKVLENPAVTGTFTPHEVNHDEDSGRRTRAPLQPVEGYYPAVIDPETFASVQRRATGRTHRAHGGKVASLVAGLCKCPLCGGAMTRVSKGPNGGRPYFVCAKAKEGAGCEYHAVRQERIEDALVGDAEWLIGTAPSGDDTLDRQVQEIETLISVTQDEGAKLVRELARRSSKIVRDRIAEIDAELERLMKVQKELYQRSATEAGPALANLHERLFEALTADPLDIARANAHMRQAFSEIVVDYKSGYLRLKWKVGGTTSIFFMWAG